MALSSYHSLRTSGKYSIDSMSDLHTSYTLHSQSSLDPIGKYDQLAALLASGKPGPDLFALFSKLEPRTVTLAVPPTVLKVSEDPPIALFTNRRGQVDLLAKSK